MRRFKRWTAALCVLALLVSAVPMEAALAYQSKCPGHGNGVMLVGAAVNMNGWRYCDHEYDSSGICPSCGDDARPPQIRPEVDISYRTGSDGHTHDYRLKVNVFSFVGQEGRKEWECKTCHAVLRETVPPLDENGMAQAGSTFQYFGGYTGGSSTTNPGSSGSGSTTDPGENTNPGGSTTDPGETTNPGGSSACDHEWTYETVKATCTKEGRSYRVCKKCGFEETLSTLKMLDHTWEQKTEAAAVGKEGRTYRVCTVCGKEETLSTTEALKPEVSTGVPGYSVRSSPLHAVGSGYEIIRVDGSLYHNSSTKTVEDRRKLLVESYDSEFRKTGTRQLNIEMEEIGGFYYGQDYNFVVFGQDNLEQSDSKEVLRVVKYTKDWQRLDAASIRGIGVLDVVGQHGNRAFAECNGMLYIHSGRATYTLKDGQEHQTNMTLCIRESDMTLTEARTAIANSNTGYVAHSIDQDIMVDSLGNLVTLDNGDAYPRGAYLFRYPQKAGGDKFTGTGSGALLAEWTGEAGVIHTGASTCALAETSQGYLSAYVDNGLGVNHANKPSKAYLVFTPKDNISTSASVTRPLMQLSSKESINFVYLTPISMDSGYILWYVFRNGNTDTFDWSDESKYTMYCAKYNADGSFSTPQKLDGVPIPYLNPVYTSGKLVWGSSPAEPDKLRFATLDGSGNVKVYGSSGTTAETGKNPFVDVDRDAYYYNGVMWALENNVTTGVTETQFQPNSTCTRGQVVTFLWRAKGCPEPQTQTNPFTDVRTSSPFYKAILWAQENGITTGVDATHFNPGGTCTNGHVLTFLWRSNGQPAASGSSSLAGQYPNQYFTGAVGWAQAKGLLNNGGSGLNPRAQCPRADIVTYLYRNAANS